MTRESSPMTTEAWDRTLFDIDIRPPESAAQALLRAHHTAALVAYDTREQLAAVARRAAVGIYHGGRIVFLGAGTSGRLGKSAERVMGIGSPSALAILAGDGLEPAARRAAEDDGEAGASNVLAIPGGLGRHDTVVGVSASGGARYVQGGLRRGGEAGSFTVAMANNQGTPIAELGFPLVLDTGAEPIKGSTRMKAGTAQKIALDTLAAVLSVSSRRGLPPSEGEMLELVESRITAHVNAVIDTQSATAEIAAAAQAIPGKLAEGGRIIVIGSSLAGFLAIQEAAELPPTFAFDEDKSLGFSSHRSDYQPNGADVVIGLLDRNDSFTADALDRASRFGALTIGIASSPHRQTLENLDHVIAVRGLQYEAREEARMTGLKVVLNTLTTLGMVYDNRTYGNLMTSVTPANEKLRKRMVKIASEATGVSEAEAIAALEASDHELPTAIVVIKTAADPATARARLIAHRNSIRAALGESRHR